MAKPKEPVLTAGEAEDPPKKKKAPKKVQAAPAPVPVDIAEIRDVMIEAALGHAMKSGVIISQWAPYAAAFRTAWPYFLRRWNEEHRGK